MGANSFLYGGQLVLAPRFRGQLGIPLLVFYISLGYSIGNSYPIKLLGGWWFRNTQHPPLPFPGPINKARPDRSRVFMIVTWLVVTILTRQQK